MSNVTIFMQATYPCMREIMVFNNAGGAVIIIKTLIDETPATEIIYKIYVKFVCIKSFKPGYFKPGVFFLKEDPLRINLSFFAFFLRLVVFGSLYKAFSGFKRLFPEPKFYLD